MNRQSHEKIQAITVCIFYSDYLKYCLNNRFHFDRWLIVTVETDIETIELCKKFSLEFCITKRIFENGASFAKGKAINDGLCLLDSGGWIVHVDCDIILPKNLRSLIREIPIDRESYQSLFGLKGRRTLCAPSNHVSTRSYKDYKNFHILFRKKLNELTYKKRKQVEFLESDFVRLRKKCRITVKAGSFLSQWENFISSNWNRLVYTFEGGEFEHLGYFQLFHSSCVEKYPERSNNANGDDTQFRDQFPRKRRLTLKADCVHIGLPLSGNTYAQLLDALLYRTKLKAEYSYLNKIKKIKKDSSSKLFFRKSRFKNVKEDRLYLIKELNTGEKTSQPALSWKLWNESIQACKTTFRLSEEKIVLAYEFTPNSKSEWFAFSIEPQRKFDRKDYTHIYFELMIDRLDCELEVGYGNKTTTEWIRINTSRIIGRKWYYFKLVLSDEVKISALNSPFIIRSVGSSKGGTISVCNICYARKRSAN